MAGGWSGIGDLIGAIAKHWTPEAIRARARVKLQKLQEEERALLVAPATAKSADRIIALRRDIERLRTYLSAA